MRPRSQSLLLVVIGLLLLANGAYLWPGNVSYENEYRAHAQEDQYPTGRLDVATIEDCRGIYTEECALDHYHARVGTVRFDDPGQVDADVLNESEQLPTFVLLDDGYYRRTATMDDGTLALSMEPVSRDHVYRVAGENKSEVDPLLQRAIENGTATTDEHRYDRRMLVTDGDVPYVVTTSGPHRGDLIGLGWPEPGRGVVALVRYVGWLAGIAVVWYGGYRYATRS